MTINPKTLKVLKTFRVCYRRERKDEMEHQQITFQLPWLPEALARRGNWNQVARSLQQSSRPGTFTPDDLEQYRQAWSRPGAYTSMLNWYRALVQKPPRPPASPRIRVPTLLIWGARDMFLGRDLAQPSIALCEDGRLILVEGASHWVHHEEANRVNELIDAFLQGRMERQPQ